MVASKVKIVQEHNGNTQDDVGYLFQAVRCFFATDDDNGYADDKTNGHLSQVVDKQVGEPKSLSGGYDPLCGCTSGG